MSRTLHRNCGVLLVLAATLALTGAPQSPSTRHHANTMDAGLKRIRNEADREYQSGRFKEAASKYDRGYQMALADGDLFSATKFLNNVGAAHLVAFKYQDAINAFLECRKLAKSQGDAETATIIDFNLAAVYLQLADVSAANDAIQQGLTTALGNDPHEIRPLLMMTLARLRINQEKTTEALGLLRRAVELASTNTNQSTLARAFDCLGEQLLESGDIAGAEEPLQQGFRLRLLLRDRDLRVSYLKLSRLRLAQGDMESAATLLERATSPPTTGLAVPAWSVYRLRGQILAAQHRPAEALAWFEKSVDFWESSHGEIASADSFRTSLATYLRPLFSSVIETDLDLRPSPNPDSLIATEEYRAIAMRQTLTESSTWRKRLPPQYWRTMEQLHATQVAQLAKETSATRSAIARHQQTLIEFEVAAGLPPASTIRNKTFEKVNASVTLRGIQKALRPEETLFSFYLGDAISAVWAVTDSGVEFHRLPSKNVLIAGAKQFKLAVQHGSGDRDRLGADLYKQLFGHVSAKAEKRPFWLIGAADELFDIPVAALVMATKDGKPVYLVERHATERISSALMLRQSSVEASHGLFLGIGDGIYNVADPRWRTDSARAGFLNISFPAARPQPVFELPRLAGSSQEILSCAGTWQAITAPLVLTGASSSTAAFQSGLRKQPAVIHIAAHVISRGDNARQTVIDLGLSPDGQPELLTYEEIANLEVPGATVIVNGCASANGGAKFGAGVMGLTRAWLMGGAQTVVGSRWPIPDDTGVLFQSLYKHWKSNGASTSRNRIVAESLQKAQLSILRSNTWRSDPKYWSAFYVVGKD